MGKLPHGGYRDLWEHLVATLDLKLASGERPTWEPDAGEGPGPRDDKAPRRVAIGASRCLVSVSRNVAGRN